jgi:hypothetical protein
LTLWSALLGLSLLPSALFGQGCVIARGGGDASIADGSGFLEPGHWQLNYSFRHFNSHRHFAGDDEQTIRSDQGTEVYNDSYFNDITANYGWSNRLSFNLTVPTVNHDRSSLYEHLGNASGQRFSTQASGIGDVRLGGSYWLKDPAGDTRGNIAVGFGLKLPTGNDEVKDIFVKSTGPVLKYVDSSIQPGDGGWGYNVELQGYWRIRTGLSAYGSASYLLNPEGRNETTGFSIPDSYLVRGGINYRVDAVKGLSVSLGLRNEGVVAHDLIGGNLGFRRPGFAVAVEPGFAYSVGRYSSALTVPIAIHRNRTTSFGSIKAGDAAFADYTINFALSMKL